MKKIFSFAMSIGFMGTTVYANQVEMQGWEVTDKYTQFNYENISMMNYKMSDVKITKVDKDALKNNLVSMLCKDQKVKEQINKGEFKVIYNYIFDRGVINIFIDKCEE